MASGLKKKGKVLSWIIFSGFMIVLLRVFQLQVILGAKYYTLSERNRIREVILPAARGRIYDRNGVVLAYSRPSFSISAVPREITEKSLKELSQLLNIPDSIIRDRLKLAVKPQRGVRIAQDVDFSMIAKVAERMRELRGVFFEVEPWRKYFFADTICHLIGYLREINREELEKLKGYRPGDYIGRAGIEAVYENYLRGRNGIKYIEVDALGRELGELSDKRATPPQAGFDLFLTLDINLQRLASKLLSPYERGAVVAIDPSTGGILCLYSKPGFDPNLFGKLTPSGWQELKSSKGSPFYNRAIMASYPPGSTIKPIVALAALRKGVSDSNFLPCRGYYLFGGRKFKCWGVHGKSDLKRGIAYSCDVYFYQLGLSTGLDELSRTALEFGFGSPTGIDLPGENRGFVPTKAWYIAHYKGNRWPRGVVLNLSIGQGEMLVTPLQLALSYTAIANNGYFYTPHLLDRIEKEGEVIVKYHPQKERIGIKKDAFKIVRDALLAAVEWGTGKSARVWGVKVCGKTGTAQNPHGKDHAWFVGYAPADNPKIVVCVLIENIGSGGKFAAPVAREIIREYLGVKPKEPEVVDTLNINE